MANSITIRHSRGKNLTVNLDGEIVRTPAVTLRLSEHKLRFVIPQSMHLLPPRVLE